MDEVSGAVKLPAEKTGKADITFYFVCSLLTLIGVTKSLKICLFNRSVTFNNDMMRITIHGWRYNTRTIWGHLE